MAVNSRDRIQQLRRQGHTESAGTRRQLSVGVETISKHWLSRGSRKPPDVFSALLFSGTVAVSRDAIQEPISRVL